MELREGYQNHRSLCDGRIPDQVCMIWSVLRAISREQKLYKNNMSSWAIVTLNVKKIIMVKDVDEKN